MREAICRWHTTIGVAVMAMVSGGCGVAGPTIQVVEPPLASLKTAARSDAMLPTHRIIAFYGHPKSKGMGVLGRLPPQRMLDSLDAMAALWHDADPSRAVVTALHMIVSVAQPHPGADGKYRNRQSDELISQVAKWAAKGGHLLFLDIQVGRSNVAAELPRLAKWLEQPNVHLGLDPEFAMAPGKVPGKSIGSMDAKEINVAVKYLAALVTRKKLPPKILVVHRFTDGMVTREEAITVDPRVQVVIHADGFGSPHLKTQVYARVVRDQPVQFAGIKMFLKLDRPMMSMSQVLALRPIPLYVQYQ